MNFAARYSARHGVPPARVPQVVLHRCLPPHARALRRPIEALYPNCFTADLDLASAVAQLERARDLGLELSSYRHHPARGGRLRRALGLCISKRRLRRLVAETFASGLQRHAAQPRADRAEDRAEPPGFALLRPSVRPARCCARAAADR